MSRTMRPKSGTSRLSETEIAQFCSVTGASVKEAKRYLEASGRHMDAAINAYYNEPISRSEGSHFSTTKLNTLFDKFKDPDGEEIMIDGTINLCDDLDVPLEDVVMLAVAYELKSPRVGQWPRKGWIDGWKSLRCDTLAAMQATLPRLREKLGSDPTYFQRVYNQTFEFAKGEGQRSLALETAQAFWSLLLPHGLQGGAVAHVQQVEEGDNDGMDGEEGWKHEYTQWWFDFLNEKGTKGISKDTWIMFLDFLQTIDSNFTHYDSEAAWPSTIDDFVEYARKRLASPPG